MVITKEQLIFCCPKAKNVDELLEVLNELLPPHNIVTPIEVAEFLGQCAHESLDFSVLEENLNYTAASLTKVWPKRFPDAANAKAYAKKPEKIANKVYANRMGNGDEDSGDGWRYHGRGAIQLTGKNNYQKFATYRGLALQDVAAYLLTIRGAIDSACWFWVTNNINTIADEEDIIAMTKKINGGVNGLKDREERIARCKIGLTCQS